MFSFCCVWQGTVCPRWWQECGRVSAQLAQQWAQRHRLHPQMPSNWSQRKSNDHSSQSTIHQSITLFCLTPHQFLYLSFSVQCIVWNHGRPSWYQTPITQVSLFPSCLSCSCEWWNKKIIINFRSRLVLHSYSTPDCLLTAVSECTRHEDGSNIVRVLREMLAIAITMHASSLVTSITHTQATLS